jgi:predicted kinase
MRTRPDNCQDGRYVSETFRNQIVFMDAVTGLIPEGGIVSPGLPALVVTGPPASGKSTLAGALARHLGAVLLDLDVVTQPLTAVVAELLGTDNLDSAELTDATRHARYETLLAIASDNLAVGRPVVLVAPFTDERRRPVAWQRLADRLTDAGGHAVLVWLRLSSEQLLVRMRERAAARDQAKLADMHRYLAWVDLQPPAVEHLAVDASDDLATQAHRILAGLS